jgi:hypothetical protein
MHSFSNCYYDFCMTETSPVLYQAVFTVLLVIVTSYAAGRVHQWYRHGLERDLAYRDGYDEASHSLFHLATRGSAAEAPAGPDDPASSPKIRARATVTRRIDAA